MSSYISKSVRNGQYIEIIKIYFSNARYNITKKKYLPTKDKPMICVIDLSCKYVSKKWLPVLADAVNFKIILFPLL